MFLLCGHHYDVSFLDDHFRLDSIYDIDLAGNVQGLARDMFAKPLTDTQCPICRSSCKEVRRYAIFHQLHTVKDSVDRAQANFSHRIQRLLGNINHIRGELDFSIDGFRNGLRPGPLAASQNELMVLQRSNALAETEANITQINGKLPPYLLSLLIDVRCRIACDAIRRSHDLFRELL